MKGTGERIISAITLKKPVARIITMTPVTGGMFRKLQAMIIRGRMFVQNITRTYTKTNGIFHELRRVPKRGEITKQQNNAKPEMSNNLD